jgi:hypothetical protein
LKKDLVHEDEEIIGSVACSRFLMRVHQHLPRATVSLPSSRERGLLSFAGVFQNNCLRRRIRDRLFNKQYSEWWL